MQCQHKSMGHSLAKTMNEVMTMQKHWPVPGQ